MDLVNGELRERSGSTRLQKKRIDRQQGGNCEKGLFAAIGIVKAVQGFSSVMIYNCGVSQNTDLNQWHFMPHRSFLATNLDLQKDRRHQKGDVIEVVCAAKYKEDTRKGML